MNAHCFPLPRLLLALLLGLLPLGLGRADSFDQLRLKWRDSLTGGTNFNLNDSQVKSRLTSLTNSALSYWNSMDKSSGRTNLWSDLASTTDSSAIAGLYSRLRAMALAYATYGSALRNNAGLAADIQGGLNWIYANRYFEGKAEYDNWYDWEIGAPLYATDLAVLLYEGLGPTGLANTLNTVNYFTPSPTNSGYPGTFTGANLADRIRIVAVRACVVRDAVKLQTARDALSRLFPYVTNSDGFYPDGSFLQHTHHPYTGSYGNVLLGDVSALLPWLKGSTWECVDPARTNVLNWVFDAYEPTLYRGAMMDMTRGRAISRSGSQDHAMGHSVLASILRLAPFGGPAETERMRSLVKAQALSDTYRNFTNSIGLAQVAEAEQLLNDTNTVARPERLGHWNFAGMTQAVHLRPGWGLALSMSSSIVANYEYMNGENAHGWFTGDGMTYLYTEETSQFSDDFWPTVDPYRLAGTTVDLTPRADGSGQSYTSPNHWVGGATLQTNGVAGMELDAYGSSLVAKKSWFMFDNEVVCLGAGITCSGSTNVLTTVEDRKFSSANTNAFVVDGLSMPTALGWQTNRANTEWCALAGAGGYFFPGRATLKAQRQARTGSWSQINSGGSTSSSSKNYLSLGFDHGIAPNNATYAYVLLPNFTATQVSNYAALPQITILENSTNVQAVKESSLKLLAANFWSDKARTVDVLSCSNKAAVLVQEGPLDLSVAVADPTQTNSGFIALSLNRSATGLLAADPAISVLQLSPTISLRVNVLNSHGRSLVATFHLHENGPSVTAQPSNLSLPLGQSASLAVGATGIEPLAYQWWHDGQAIAGATNSLYSLSAVQSAQQGLYWVRVTNAYGALLSSNALVSVMQTALWGDTSLGQGQMPLLLTNLVALAGGTFHSLALRAEGSVLAWGNNAQGQCAVPGGLSDAVAIAAGGYHSLALRANGRVVGWGADDSGQCSIPAGLSGVVGVAAGTWHSLALRADGSVVGWGDNGWSQISIPAGLSQVSAIAAAGNHSLALKRDGSVVAWGENTDPMGQFAGQSSVPAGLSNVVAIAAGSFHSLAVKADGSVVAWGDNSQGQLNVPGSLTNALAASGGVFHSLALQADGKALGWGADGNGQSSLPSSLSNLVAVAAGGYHSLVLQEARLSGLRCVAPFYSGSSFSVRLPSWSGKFYGLEFKNSLSESNWSALPAVPGNGGLQSLINPAPAASQRFYRVRQ